MKDDGAASLQQLTDRHSLQLLSSAVQGEQATATFACGGTLAPRSTHDYNPVEGQGQLTCPPVILRWDSLENNVARRLELPISPGQEFELNGLLGECQPATFGIGGVDVLDESYRKASKLDNTQFSTNFNPYDYGIVDTISQVLFPSVDKSSSEDLGLELRGVRAELYKLNVGFRYSSRSFRYKTYRAPIRSTLVHRECSILMLIHHAGQANSVLSLSVFLVLIQAASCSSDMRAPP